MSEQFHDLFSISISLELRDCTVYKKASVQSTREMQHLYVLVPVIPSQRSTTWKIGKYANWLLWPFVTNTKQPKYFKTGRAFFVKVLTLTEPRDFLVHRKKHNLFCITESSLWYIWFRPTVYKNTNQCMGDCE
jgi:hypothetical protein